MDESEVDASKVRILSTVRVMNHKVKKEQAYTLVSAEEADFKTGRISVSSPIGKSLLGKALGDKITISTPSGKLQMEILDISR